MKNEYTMKLKAYIQYWIALCSIIFVASCSDDLDLPVETNVREGIPVEIKVKFGTSLHASSAVLDKSTPVTLKPCPSKIS